MAREAHAFLSERNPLSIQQDLEHGRIAFSDGSFADAVGKRDSVSIKAIQGYERKKFLGLIPYKKFSGPLYKDSSRSAAATYQAHTHGRGSEYNEFSPADMAISRRFDIPVFMTNQTGNLQVYIAGVTPGGQGHVLCRACVPVK
jgi:hypothetical protein